ncbi:MAG: hypothetical protein LBL28_05735 [Treponema sp.]|nr:hypothetical protein [Treponema sp.]
MSSKKQGFLSWSGTLSHEIALSIKDEILDTLFGDYIEMFISSEIGVGSPFASEIFTRLTESDFGIVCITAENIEKPWVSFECGGLIKNMEKKNLYVMLVDVSFEMLGRLNPPVSEFQAVSIDKDGIINLIKKISGSILRTESAIYENKIHEGWNKNEKNFADIIQRHKPAPNNYYKQIKYMNAIDDSNLSIPSVFSIYKQHLFFASLNHSFILDLTISEQKDNFLSMVDTLLTDSNKKVRILISDIWDEYVISSYKNMIQKMSRSFETDNLNKSLINKDSEHYIENVIIKSRGEESLRKIKEYKQFEIRKIKIISDTFVFVDPKSDNGICYFSLFTSPGGRSRPVFTFNKKDDNSIFNTYYNFIEEGWYNMSDPVWPI